MKSHRWQRSVYPRDPPGDVGGLICVAAVVAIGAAALLASDWFRTVLGIAAAGGIIVAVIMRKAARDATISLVLETLVLETSDPPESVRIGPNKGAKPGIAVSK